jgi:hypothetical protein
MWEYETTLLTVLNLNFCIQEDQRQLTMSYQPNDNQPNTFLYTDSIFAGMLWAKFSTSSVYLSIGTYSKTPTCYLGDLLSSTIYDIDFQIEFTSDVVGEQFVPIYIGYGDNIISFQPDDLNQSWNIFANSRDGWYDDPDEMTIFGWEIS